MLQQPTMRGRYASKDYAEAIFSQSMAKRISKSPLALAIAKQDRTGR
jgi:hypothetical protein